MLRAAIEGIKKRGNSDLGDKTLLDASSRRRRAREVARGGRRRERRHPAVGDDRPRTAEATKEMLAKRGRASYTGERSIGTLDAGAVAVAVMFEQVADAWAATE